MVAVHWRSALGVAVGCATTPCADDCRFVVALPEAFATSLEQEAVTLDPPNIPIIVHLDERSTLAPSAGHLRVRVYRTCGDQKGREKPDRSQPDEESLRCVRHFRLLLGDVRSHSDRNPVPPGRRFLPEGGSSRKAAILVTDILRRVKWRRVALRMARVSGGCPPRRQRDGRDDSAFCCAVPAPHDASMGKYHRELGHTGGGSTR